MILCPFTAHLGLGAACHGVSDIPHHVYLARALVCSVAVVSHGFLWQTICRPPSPPLFLSGWVEVYESNNHPKYQGSACEPGIDQLRALALQTGI